MSLTRDFQSGIARLWFKSHWRANATFFAFRWRNVYTRCDGWWRCWLQQPGEAEWPVIGNANNQAWTSNLNGNFGEGKYRSIGRLPIQFFSHFSARSWGEHPTWWRFQIATLGLRVKLSRCYPIVKFRQPISVRVEKSTPEEKKIQGYFEIFQILSHWNAIKSLKVSIWMNRGE